MKLRVTCPDKQESVMLPLKHAGTEPDLSAKGRKPACSLIGDPP
jgi:hypothetical protein